ncbi:MAG: preprotein translocase subunit Sec61beta [Candidatus Methanofastidiosia archaeon]
MVKPRRENVGGALPPTGAGLIRYFDEDTQGIKIGPRLVIIGVVVVIMAFMALHIVGF